MTKNFATRLNAALAAGLLVLPLAGCITVQQAPEQSSAAVDSSSPSSDETATQSPEPSSASASASPSIDGTATQSSKAVDGTATPSGNVPKETAHGDSFQSGFKSILKHADKTKCTGNETFAENGKVLFLIGNCKNIKITGTGNMIVSNHMKSLDISGAGNIIAVKSVRNVDVSGTGNVVAWRSGDTRSHDTGDSNSLGRNALDGVELAF